MRHYRLFFASNKDRSFEPLSPVLPTLELHDARIATQVRTMEGLNFSLGLPGCDLTHQLNNCHDHGHVERQTAGPATQDSNDPIDPSDTLAVSTKSEPTRPYEA